LAKLSSAGEWQWAKRAASSPTFGSKWAYAYGLAVTPSGDTFLSGSLSKAGGITFDSINVADDNDAAASGVDVFVAKCSSDGVWQWVATSRMPNAGYRNANKGHAIAILPSGGAIVTGEYLGTLAFGGTTLISAGLNDAFVARVSDAGEWQWAVSAGGAGRDRGHGISVAEDGSISVTGELGFKYSASVGGFLPVEFGSIALPCTGASGYSVACAKVECKLMSGGGEKSERVDWLGPL
jgi:hypothetical protein